MKTLLAGDIGGTKTILRLVEADSVSQKHQKIALKSIYEQNYPSQEYTDLVPMVVAFLNEAQNEVKTSFSVTKACFGIAGPVVKNTSELTNLSWALSGERLAKDLSIEQVSLINDFAAIGYGILGLDTVDVCTLQEVDANQDAPIAVIGAGTGLGQGFLIPVSSQHYRVFNSEGGHADFAPRSPLEFQLLDYLQKEFSLERVSVERVVSGLGIASIYQFLRHKDSNLESPSMATIFQRWKLETEKGEKTIDLAAEIAQASQKGDYLCQQTMKLFIEAYGAEAGNLAVKLLPYGGLYIAGGIATKNIDLLKQGNFINAFLAKGRMRSLLKQIPVHIILNPKVGLIGAAVRASQL